MLTEYVLSRPPSLYKGEYRYSNANYVIASLIIEIVTNITAEEVFKLRLLEPLNITTAGFGPGPEHSDTSVDNPWPHSPSNSAPIPITNMSLRDNPPAINLAGRLHISLADYNKFLQVHLDGALDRTSNPNTLNLDAASFAKLHMPYPDMNRSSPGYGYTYGAWERQNYTGKTNFTLQHYGSNLMNYAFTMLDAGAEAVYTAVTNVGGDDAEEAVTKAVAGIRNGRITLT
jgi:CubicO group peptidase (beta-lactamase class C family)